jgi:hypothetical protein
MERAGTEGTAPAQEKRLARHLASRVPDRDARDSSLAGRSPARPESAMTRRVDMPTRGRRAGATPCGGPRVAAGEASDDLADGGRGCAAVTADVSASR